eukprot:scaffold154_cov286-Pinguiococcus_pyrenoidosus.AAC.1
MVVGSVRRCTSRSERRDGQGSGTSTGQWTSQRCGTVAAGPVEAPAAPAGRPSLRSAALSPFRFRPCHPAGSARSKARSITAWDDSIGLRRRRPPPCQCVSSSFRWRFGASFASTAGRDAGPARSFLQGAGILVVALDAASVVPGQGRIQRECAEACIMVGTWTPRSTDYPLYEF